MEQAFERKRSSFWYALPIIGAAIPTAVFLTKRAMGYQKHIGKEAALLHKSHIGFQDAANAALQYVPGTPIEVELEDKEGSPVWQVDIVPQKGGRVREVLIDAKNGKLLEMKSASEG